MVAAGHPSMSFELDAFKGKDGPLGSLQYLNAIGYAGDVEVGYEF
jgi:hypothetical protein